MRSIFITGVLIEVYLLNVSVNEIREYLIVNYRLLTHNNIREVKGGSSYYYYPYAPDISPLLWEHRSSLNQFNKPPLNHLKPLKSLKFGLKFFVKVALVCDFLKSLKNLSYVTTR